MQQNFCSNPFNFSPAKDLVKIEAITFTDPHPKNILDWMLNLMHMDENPIPTHRNFTLKFSRYWFSIPILLAEEAFEYA